MIKKVEFSDNKRGNYGVTGITREINKKNWYDEMKQPERMELDLILYQQTEVKTSKVDDAE